MQVSWFEDILKDWQSQGLQIPWQDERRLLRLLRAISIRGRGRVVARDSHILENDPQLVNLRTDWARKVLKTTLDSYARTLDGIHSFGELLDQEPFSSEDGSKLVIEHLEHALQWLSDANTKIGFIARDTLLIEALRTASMETAINGGLASPVEQGSTEVLIGEAYRNRLIELINNAQSNVWIAVSPMSFPRTSGHPVTPIFEAIKKLRHREVDVYVLIATDTDFKDGSTAVQGDKILRLLLRYGVNILLLHPSLPYHGRIVTIDSQYLLIGNHAWTGPTLQNNGDVSISVMSPALASQAEQWLLSLAWRSGSRFRM